MSNDIERRKQTMNGIKISTVLDLIKNKNSMGYKLLYKHHYKLLFSTAFAVTKNEQDSQDVVQNVVYKLSNMNANRFPEKGEVSWLYRVVKNEAINFVKNRKQYSDIDDVELPVVDINLDSLIDIDSYYSLIESLNEQQKEVVTLKVLGDFSHKEIARMLDKPIGTIQWIYSTSIKKLRVSLGAMASLVMVLSISAFARVANLYSNFKIPQQSLPQSDPGISSSPTRPSSSPIEESSLLLEIINDNILVVLLSLIVLSILGIIIFMKFSDKIPTKLKR